jgi:GDP-L-fucose synthase
MPTNVYGPGDNYDLENSHVLPALIRKFIDAKSHGDESVTLWGTGSPRREFIYSDDLASACLFLLENYDDSVAINVGTGEDLSILDLASMIKQATGFEGIIHWDKSKPDGTPRKLLNIERISGLGWKPRITLQEGISLTSKAYVRDHS